MCRMRATGRGTARQRVARSRVPALDAGSGCWTRRVRARGKRRIMEAIGPRGSLLVPRAAAPERDRKGARRDRPRLARDRKRRALSPTSPTTRTRRSGRSRTSRTGARSAARTTCCTSSPARSRGSSATRPRTTGTSRAAPRRPSGATPSSSRSGARRTRCGRRSGSPETPRTSATSPSARPRPARGQPGSARSAARLAAQLQGRLRGALARGGDGDRGQGPPRGPRGLRRRSLGARDPPGVLPGGRRDRERAAVRHDRGARREGGDAALRVEAPHSGRQGAAARRRNAGPWLRLRHHAHDTREGLRSAVRGPDRGDGRR